MITYEFGRWGLSFVFSFEGSVFPKAFVLALPHVGLAVGLWYFFQELEDSNPELVANLRDVTVSQVWVGYNWVLAFLVGFRAQRAYARWWEGGTLLQQARGEWFNAYSSLIAFSSNKPELKQDVDCFQELLGRLMSMLFAAALQTVSREPDMANFEIIDVAGIEVHSLFYLLQKHDKCEVILQWVQRLIVQNMESGVVPIPPPVISRVFQELSRGIVNVHNVRKITEFQFPFPFAQFISVMLVLHWFMNPVVIAILVGSPAWAALVSFVPCFAFWGINYISAEIEQPFGDGANDMPMRRMQLSMNTSIVTLLERRSQEPPQYIPTSTTITSARDSRRTNRDTTTVMDCAQMVIETVRTSAEHKEWDASWNTGSSSLRTTSLMSLVLQEEPTSRSESFADAPSKPISRSDEGFLGVMKRTRSKLQLLVRSPTRSLHLHVNNEQDPVSRKRISTVQRGAPHKLKHMGSMASMVSLSPSDEIKPSRRRQSSDAYASYDAYSSYDSQGGRSQPFVINTSMRSLKSVSSGSMPSVTSLNRDSVVNVSEEAHGAVMPPRAKAQALPFTTPRLPEVDSPTTPRQPETNADKFSSTPASSKSQHNRKLSFACLEAEVINWDVAQVGPLTPDT